MGKRKYPRGRPPYPRNWGKVQRVLKRIIGQCELCGSTDTLSVHHKGIPFANGRPNHPSNKHDLRRENLLVLCRQCHDHIEMQRHINQRNRRRKTAWKRTALERFHVGTGLVPFDPDWAQPALWLEKHT